jgi:hypothetical protein
MSDDLVAQFADLFEGRKDAYGTEEGGCWRPELLDSHGQYHMIIDGHLSGNTPIGVYPLRLHEDRTAWVKWGCVDFDEGDEESWVHAVNVVNVLSQTDITGWIERSRSKGYHVWVFAEGWVPATLMREALLAACQIVDAPTKEVNPKQTELSGDGVGNYVRLPYPGGDDGGGTRRKVIMLTFDNVKVAHSLATFVSGALATRCTAEALQRVAKLYTPPAPTRPDYIPDHIPKGGLHRRMTGLAYRIYTDGPYEANGDRSGALWRLAQTLVRDGNHTYDEMLTLLTEADSRWGKFHERPNGAELLQRTLDKVIGNR